MNPEKHNFLQKKLLQENVDSKSEEEVFETGLRNFIKETGVPIEIKEIRFADPEERQQAKILRDRLEEIKNCSNSNFEVYKEVVLLMLEYVDQAIIIDNLTDHDDDAIRDNQIEKVLDERSRNPAFDPSIQKEYGELYSGYAKSRLHRNLINRGVHYYDEIFKDDKTLTFLPKTEELVGILHKALEPVSVSRMEQVKLYDEKGNVRFGEDGNVMLSEPKERIHPVPKYDFMTEDEKIKISDTTVSFTLSCVNDLIASLEKQRA